MMRESDARARSVSFSHRAVEAIFSQLLAHGGLDVGVDAPHTGDLVGQDDGPEDLAECRPSVIRS